MNHQTWNFPRSPRAKLPRTSGAEKLKEPHMHGDLCNGLYECYKTPTLDEFVTQP